MLMKQVGCIGAGLCFILFAGCLPEQQAAYCESNEDCPEGMICSSFSRRCIMDLKYEDPSQIVRGQFYCCDGYSPNTAGGYIDSSYGETLARELDLDPQDAPFDVSSSCVMDYDAEMDAYALYGYIREATASTDYLIWLVLSPDTLVAGGEQTSNSSDLGLITAVQADTSGLYELWSTDRGEVGIIDVIPSTEGATCYRGTFFANEPSASW